MSEPLLSDRSSESLLVRAIGFWALTAAIVNVTIGGGALIPLTAIAALLGILSTLQRAEWIAMGGVSMAVACLYAAVLWTRR